LSFNNGTTTRLANNGNPIGLFTGAGKKAAYFGFSDGSPTVQGSKWKNIEIYIERDPLPRDLMIKEMNSVNVSLEWNPVIGASYYNVYEDGALVSGNITGLFKTGILRPSTGIREYTVKAFDSGNAPVSDDEYRIVVKYTSNTDAVVIYDVNLQFSNGGMICFTDYDVIGTPSSIFDVIFAQYDILNGLVAVSLNPGDAEIELDVNFERGAMYIFDELSNLMPLFKASYFPTGEEYEG